MNNKKIDIAVLGHILKEKIVFPDKVIYPVLGSPVAYSSTCMASLGAKVGIVTKIGGDYPENLLEVFDIFGVNKDGLIVGESSTNNELIYEKNGNKTLKFLTKAEDIFFTDVPLNFLDAEIFYICPMDYEVGIETIKELSKLKKIMVVDLGGYGGGTSGTHPEKKDGHELKEICPYFDIAKTSIEDCYHIFDKNIGDEKEIAGKLLSFGTEICVITLGQRGSYVRTEKFEKYIPPFPTDDIIDRTGAGDCFAAGFLANYITGNDPVLASVYGTAVTSYVIERSGGVIVSRMPSIQEAKRRAAILMEMMG